MYLKADPKREADPFFMATPVVTCRHLIDLSSIAPASKLLIRRGGCECDALFVVSFLFLPPSLSTSNLLNDKGAAMHALLIEVLKHAHLQSCS